MDAVSMRRTRLVVVDRSSPDRTAIEDAAVVIRSGGLVAFPTETVYGLGAHALDRHAVLRIFEAKGRPSTDPLIVHIEDVAQIDRLADIPSDMVTLLASRFWPGPLTLIVRKDPAVPLEVTAGLDTVAVRVPAHPVARALLASAAVPIAAPSANLFSRPSPTRAAHVLADLDGRIDLVIDGGTTDIGVESTVLDLTTDPPLVRRPGGVSIDDLRAILPTIAAVATVMPESTQQISPGQLLRHYAPRARMTLFDGDRSRVRHYVQVEAEQRLAAGARIGLLAPAEDLVVIQRALSDHPRGNQLIGQRYGSLADPVQSARELFDGIRSLDAAGVTEILATLPEPDGIGVALRDRLTRAAEGRVVQVAEGR